MKIFPGEGRREKAVDKHLLKDGIGPVYGYGLFIFGRVRLVQVIIQSDSNNLFYRNNLRPGVIPKDLRDVNRFAVLEIFPKLVDVVRLVDKINLFVIILANSSTMLMGLNILLSDMYRLANCARVYRMSTSVSTILRISGLCTFTTTFSPVLSCARCACPSDAAATGVCSKEANILSGSLPSDSFICFFDVFVSKGGDVILELTQFVANVEGD